MRIQTVGPILLALALVHVAVSFDILDVLKRNRFGPRPEDWHGRWMPDKPTSVPPSQVSKSNSEGSRENSTKEMWTGRWFPDKPSSAETHFDGTKVTTENSKPTLKANPKTDTWTGQWFPDKPSFADGKNVTENTKPKKANPTTETWTGRWFPDKPTSADTPIDGKSVVTENSKPTLKANLMTDSWTGRWIPDEPSANVHIDGNNVVTDGMP